MYVQADGCLGCIQVLLQMSGLVNLLATQLVPMHVGAIFPLGYI